MPGLSAHDFGDAIRFGAPYLLPFQAAKHNMRRFLHQQDTLPNIPLPENVTQEFDGLLAKHGYAREGNIYRVERANRDTIAFFCHFALECSMTHLPFELFFNSALIALLITVKRLAIPRIK